MMTEYRKNRHTVMDRTHLTVQGTEVYEKIKRSHYQLR